jgi:tetratricopeptide (TPR) repeat protein
MRAFAVFCPVFFAVPTWLPISVAQQDAEDARKLYAKGVELVATNVDMSIAFFSKAIAIDNRFTAAYVKRGDAFWRKKEFSNALKDVTRALALDPRNAEAFQVRGNVFLDQGLHEKALRDFNESIAINPRDPETYNYRGIFYYLIKRFKTYRGPFG